MLAPDHLCFRKLMPEGTDESQVAGSNLHQPARLRSVVEKSHHPGEPSGLLPYQGFGPVRRTRLYSPAIPGTEHLAQQSGDRVLVHASVSTHNLVASTVTSLSEQPFDCQQVSTMEISDKEKAGDIG